MASFLNLCEGESRFFSTVLILKVPGLLFAKPLQDLHTPASTSEGTASADRLVYHGLESAHLKRPPFFVVASVKILHQFMSSFESPLK